MGVWTPICVSGPQEAGPWSPCREPVRELSKCLIISSPAQHPSLGQSSWPLPTSPKAQYKDCPWDPVVRDTKSGGLGFLRGECSSSFPGRWGPRFERKQKPIWQTPRRPVLRTLMATVLSLCPQCSKMGPYPEQACSCRGRVWAKCRHRCQ